MSEQTETALSRTNATNPSPAGVRRQLIRRIVRILDRWAVPVLLVAAPAIAIAAQFTFATSPLFLTTSAKPNVVFLTDDSATMDYGVVTSENNGILSVTVTSGSNTCSQEFRYTYPGASSGNPPAKNNANNDQYVAPTESVLETHGGGGLFSAPYGGIWRMWNKDYNKLYYNPSVTYTSWEGADSTGVNYSNVSLTAAPFDPYIGASGGIINLTSDISYQTRFCKDTGVSETGVNVTVYPARYYYWSGSGEPAASDSHTLVEIKSTAALCSVNGNTQPCLQRTYANEIQNFANWFSYYRKRDLAAKNAISKFIGTASNSGYRVAIATLNSSDAASNISIVALNASTTTGETRSVLNAVYTARPTGDYTYLRTKLDQVGKYYKCESGNIFGLSAGSANCPIQSAADGGACQQNFTVMVTDGVYNDETFTGIGNTDGSGTYAGGAYADGSGVNYDNTLADVAMYYYKTDLSATLSNQVPVMAGTDENTQQHMVTYAVALGLSGTLTAMPTSSGNYYNWYAGYNPTATGVSDAIRVNDLRHAAYNGRGQYLSATSGDALASALSTAQNAVSDRTGSSAAVAVNSRSLSTSTRLYQARFNSGEWSGDLRALSIAADGSVESQVWSAKEQLKSQDWSSGRFILTANTVSHGIPFRWVTSGDDALTAAQMSYLNTNPDTSALDSRGEARLWWLRGDISNEGTGYNFRERSDSFKLGDIVDSTPIFVGAPPNLPDMETSPHSTFRSNFVNRSERIYVGANDGMLHGFDASTGQEKIAYVPSGVYENLHYLTSPNYSTSHKYYVNGSPTVGDAYASFTKPTSCSGTDCWRTVLASGMGSGSKGVFALDVTDPTGTRLTGLSFSSESNANNIVMWEFTDTTTPDDMGYIFGQPTITKLHNNQWGVIFGNGYNSTNEKAVLYILDIKDGSIIKKIDLSNGTTGQGNGLSAPAVVDTDGDYIADYVYAGDLKGNLWKVNITSSNTNSWKSAYLSGSNPEAMFTAVDSSSRAQAITVRPEVGSHPTGEDGYMVYFGTGRYLADGDNSATNTSIPINTFYGIWDDGTTVTRAKLLGQTISVVTAGTGDTVRTVTNTTIQGWGASGNCNSDGTGNCQGCYLDLRTGYTDSLGERSVSNPVLLGGTLPRLIFTTLIPSSDACSFGGTSWLMELSPTNCGRLSQSVFDIDGDGTVTNDSGDLANGVAVSGINPGIGIMPEPVILRDPANGQDLKAETGSTGAVTTIKNYVSGSTGGRQSWRQLK